MAAIADQIPPADLSSSFAILIHFRVGSCVVGFVVDDHNLGVALQPPDQVFKVAWVFFAEDDQFLWTLTF